MVMDLFAGGAVPLAVIALTQPPVQQDRQYAAEGNRCGLHGAGQVRAEYRRHPISRPSTAQAQRQLTAPLGQPSRRPAGRDSGLVVLADGVRLEDDLHRHEPEL